MAANGYAVAIPDYRIFPEAHFPDFLEDTAGAIGWLHRHAAEHGIDGQRIALIGHSAGGGGRPSARKAAWAQATMPAWLSTSVPSQSNTISRTMV